MSRPAPTEKLQLLLVVSAMAAAIVLYVGLAAFLVSSAEGPARPLSPLLRPLLLGAAFALVVAAAFVTPVVRSGAPASTLPPPAAFRSRVLAAAAIAEGGSIVGLVLAFLERRILDAALPAAAALALLALHVVPNGLRYFAARERDAGAPPPLSPE